MQNIFGNMKPYSQKKLTDSCCIFNYRVSRSWNTSENAFGIYIHRFRCLASKLLLDPDKSSLIALVCCGLHNLLISWSGQSDALPGFLDEVQSSGDIIEGEWRQNQSTQNICSLEPERCNHSINATAIREEFREYFEGEGRVSWQWKHIHRI